MQSAAASFQAQLPSSHRSHQFPEIQVLRERGEPLPEDRVELVEVAA